MADNTLGALLWTGDMETGDISQWNTSGGNYIMNPGNVLINEVSTENPHSGVYSIKTQVTAGTSQMASTQYFRHSPEGEPNVNPDAIYTCWYHISNGFDMVGISWHNIMQWKAKYSNDISYPIFTTGFNVRGGKGSGGPNYLELRYAREHFPLGGGSYNIPELVEVNVPINEWFKVQVRYIQSVTTNGRVILWLNDQRIYDVSGIVTKPLTNNNGDIFSEMSWSCNNYAQGLNPAISTLFIDDASINLHDGSIPDPDPPLNLQIKINGEFAVTSRKIKVNDVFVNM